MDVAKEEGLFTFLEIIKAAELEETLRHMKHFTMFAPSETAMYCMYSNFTTDKLKRTYFLAQRKMLFYSSIKSETCRIAKKSKDCSDLCS